MADLLPLNFTIPSETILSSYNWVDVASGTGYIDYTLTTNEIDGANGVAPTRGYYLSTRNVEPGNENAGGGWEPGGCRQSYIGDGSTKTFATTFKVPKVISGDVFFNFSIAGSSGAAATRTVTINLYKNAGVIATETCCAPTTSTVKSYNVILPVSQTNFGIGDSFKVSIGITAGEATPYNFLYHDPINRNHAGGATTGGLGNLPAITASTNPTEAIISVPFLIAN